MKQVCFQYRLCLLTTSELSIKGHPEALINHLGIPFEDPEPCPLGDCWFFYSDRYIDNLPEFLSVRVWVEDFPLNRDSARYLSGSTGL